MTEQKQTPKQIREAKARLKQAPSMEHHRKTRWRLYGEVEIEYMENSNDVFTKNIPPERPDDRWRYIPVGREARPTAEKVIYVFNYPPKSDSTEMGRDINLWFEGVEEKLMYDDSHGYKKLEAFLAGKNLHPITQRQYQEFIPDEVRRLLDKASEYARQQAKSGGEK